uniref:Uncharacterized protein n=1 Tax=Rhizophora mucronata TaxID=61149 RepID=A0A2P2Q8T0_RHIMU
MLAGLFPWVKAAWSALSSTALAMAACISCRLTSRMLLMMPLFLPLLQLLS